MQMESQNGPSVNKYNGIMSSRELNAENSNKLVARPLPSSELEFRKKDHVSKASAKSEKLLNVRPSFPELSQNDADVGVEFEKARLRVMPNGAEASLLPSHETFIFKTLLKRGKLERLHSEPILERDEGKSDCESPCNSTTSELLPACAVRVFQPSPRGVPVITAPSRNHSRMSSVESGTPTAMLDALPQTYNNFNSTPQGFLRNSSARIQIAKPIQFDAPKTPFEERLQQQANAIRKASVTSNLSEGEPQVKNISSLELSSSTSFIYHFCDISLFLR
uniref:Uncharacterized protein n=1 Tax=Heterorhabditis bacteriophora TaxID=37862 RepID=A0A1I7WUE7_HETBA